MLAGFADTFFAQRLCRRCKDFDRFARGRGHPAVDHIHASGGQAAKKQPERLHRVEVALIQRIDPGGCRRKGPEERDLNQVILPVV